MCETETKFSVPAATWTRNQVWFSEVELELKPEFGEGGYKNQTWNQIFGSISTCGTQTGTETVLNYFL